MGEVYLASLVGELGFEKRLVIKTILPEHSAKPKFVEMFATEARTAVSLTHGNVVPIYELGRADDTLYIVMGFVDGPSLARMLAAYRGRSEPAPVGLVLHITRQVLTGLAYAHTEEAGRPAVVHRDISPSNVLVDRSGQVRILDFGIAVHAHVASGVHGGSAGYMAPEQARAELADPSADVFSTACMVYELITLERAFPKGGVWTAPDMSALPTELAEVLSAALSLDAKDRPADAIAFLNALGPALVKHAGAITDTKLAAHLRELFPDGWHRKEDSGVEPLTPVTNVEPKTYATRLTGVDAAPAVVPASPAVLATPVAVEPRRRGLGLALLAGLGLLTAGFVVLLPSGPTDVAPPVPAAARVVTATAATSTTPPPAPEAVPPLAAAPTPHAAGDQPGRPAPPPETPAVWLTLNTTPTDAHVTLDGVQLTGSSPYRIPIPAHGEAPVRVHKLGYVDQLLSVQAGQPAGTQTIGLRREPPKGKGKLRVLSTAVSWAEVSVNGKRRGTTPMRPLELPAGTHRLVVRCVPDVCPSPRTLLDKTITIRAGETTQVNAR